jgi:hypothetical protein
MLLRSMEGRIGENLNPQRDEAVTLRGVERAATF